MQYLRQWVRLVGIGALSLIFVTCDLQVGLGETPDILPPEITFTSPSALSVIRGNFTVTGAAKDDNDLDKVELEYETAPNTWRKVDATLTEAKTWSAPVPSGLGVANALIEGRRDLRVTAYDKSGKKTTSILSLYVDNTPPTVLVTVPAIYGANRPILSTSLTIEGRAYDNNFSPQQIQEVYVTLLNASSEPVSARKLASGRESWSVQFVFPTEDSTPTTDFPQGLSDGDAGETYGYRVEAVDGAGNVSTHFYHAKDLFDLLLSGQLFPPMNALGQVDQSTSGLLSGVGADGLSSAELAALRVTTNAGVTQGLTFDRDVDRPSIVLTNLIAGDGQSLPVINSRGNLAGTVTDDKKPFRWDPAAANYDPNYLTAEVTPAGGTAFTLRPAAPPRTRALNNSVNFLIDLVYPTGHPRAGQTLDNGTYSVVLRARDADWTASPSRNESSLSAQFIVDNTAPAFLSVSPGNGGVVGGAGDVVTITAVVEDDSESLTLNVEYRENDSQSWTVLAPSGVTVPDDDEVTEKDGKPAYKRTFEVTIPLNSTQNTLSVRMSVTDLAGFEGFSPNLNYTIDREAPEITLDSLPTWISLFAGATTATGSVSGTALGSLEVYFALVEQGSPAPARGTASPWTKASGNAVWNGTLSLPTVDGGGNPVSFEGAYTLYAYSVDQAGNQSELTVSQDFLVDQSAPSLTETTVGTQDAQISRNAVAFGGAASDTNALSGVSVRVNGGTAVALAVASGSWTYVHPNTADGDFALVFTATDSAGRSTSLSRRVIIDNTAPTLPVINALPAGFLVNELTVSGTAADAAGGSGLDRVETRFNGTGAWNALTGTGSWFGTLDVSGLAEGTHTLNVRSVDRTGNLSPVADLSFVIDRGLPEINGLNIGTGTQYRQSDFTLAFTAADSQALKQVTVTRNGTSLVNAAFTTETSQAYSLAQVAADLGDGVYQYVITVTDIVDRVTTVSRSVVIDTAAPELAVTNPLANEIIGLTSGNYLMRGTVGDAGSGLKRLEYSFSADYSGAVQIVNPGLNWTWNIPAASFGSQGNKILYVRALDQLDQVSEVQIQVNVDTAVPTLSVSAAGIPDSTLVNRRTPVVFTGTAGDTNELTSVTVSVNGAAPISVTDTNGDGNASTLFDTWTWTLTDAVEGQFELVFTATDVAGRPTALTRRVFMDVTNPATPAFTSSPGAFVTNSLVIEGTSSDGGSGIQNVFYRINSGSTVTATGTDNWFATLNLGPSGANLPEGDHTVTVWAVDRSGNTSAEQSQTFTVDRQDPAISSASNLILYTNVDILITGTASDTNGLATWDDDADGGTPEVPYVQFTVDGGAAVRVLVTGGAWQVPVDTSGGDGSYTYVITSVDRVGRTSSISRTLIVDNSAPTFVVDNIAANGSTVVNTASYTVTGTAGDGLGSGLKSVQYRLNSGTWTDTSGTSSWVAVLNGLSDGTGNTFELRVEDNSGNVGFSDVLTFAVDSAPPTFTETASGLTNSTVVYRNADVPFGGVATDGNGVTSVTVTYLKDGTGPTTLLNDTTNDGVWSTSLNTALGDGVYELTFTATDGVGKTSSFIRNVVIDTAQPDLTITAPVTNELVDGPAYTIRGQVTDNGGRGVTQLQYSRDNSTWTDIPIAGLNWSVASVNFTTPVGAETAEGGRTLYVRASDGLNGMVNQSVSFNFDSAAPTITETLSGLTASVVNRNTAVNFGGSSSDTNAVSTVTVTTNGGAAANVTNTGTAFSTWTYTLPAVEGTYALVFEATDVAGRKNLTTLQRNVVIDLTAPSTPVITSSAGSFVSNSLAVSGTAADALSGVQTVFYRFNGTAGNPATGTLTGTDNWFATLNIGSTGANLPLGSHTLYVWSQDRAGNLSAEASQAFTVDRADPTLSTAEAATQGTATSTLLTGTAGDDLLLSSVTATVRKNAEPVNAATVGGTPAAWEIDTADDTTGNGTYVYTLIATDSVGRTSTPLVLTVVVDNAAPTASVTNLAADGSTRVDASSYVVTGTAADVGLSGLASVEFSLNGGAYGPVTGTSSWTATLSGLTDGLDQEFRIRATDNAGNVYGPVLFEFDVDLAAPAFTETTSTIPNATLVSRNANVTFGGAATDGNGVASVVVTYSKDGGAPVVLLNDTTDDGTWAATLSTSLGDGSYQLTFTATDGVGKTSSFVRNVLMDTASPDLTITAPAPGELVSDTAYTIRGQVTDNGGRGVFELQYSRVSAAGPWTTIPLSGLNWSLANVDFSSGGQGSKTLYVRASDGLNPDAAASVSFNYDTAVPILNETVSGLTAALVNRNAAVDFGGTATDTNAVSTVTVSLNGGAAVNVTNTGTAFSTWTYQLPALEGSYVLLFRATDVAGRTATVERNVVMDLTAPAAPSITSSAGAYVTSTLAVSGTAADALSGVQTVSFRLNGSNGDAATGTLTGTDNWFGTVNVAALAEGNHTIYVWATDRAGNRGAEASQVFTVDRNDPALSSAAPASQPTKVNMNLTGTASDANGLASVTATVSKDGGASTAATVGGTTSWSIAIDTADGDGSYVYTVTATDTVGRTNTLTRTVVIDTTAPTVAVTSHSNGNVVSAANLVVSGTAADALSGVAGVEYRLNGGSWTALSGTTNWNGTIPLGSEGAKTLDFRSRDALDTYSTVATITINLDTNPPTLTETAVGTTTARRSADFVLSGTASDTNGLKTWDHDSNGGTAEVPYVEISVDGGAATRVQVIGGNWSFPVTVAPDGSDDGDRIFVVTATDVVDKPASVTRTVSIDATAPNLSIDGVIAGLNVTSNEVNGVITFRFSADDAGVGLERVGGLNRAYYTLVSDGTPVATGASDIAGWTLITSSSSVFTFTYDTTAVANGAYDLWVGLRDGVTTDFGAGNVPNAAAVLTDLDINQYSDRPVIGFDNMNDAAALNSENGFGQNPTILLTIEDDDRVDVSLLQYRIDANNDGLFNSVVELGTAGDKWEDESVWNDVEEVPTSDRSLAQAKIKLIGFPQGAYRIQVRARDNTNTDPWTTIYGDNNNYTWRESPIVRFSVDFGPPSIAVTAPLAGVYRENFAISGSASDALGVIKIEYTLDGGSTYETLYDVPGGTDTTVPFSDTVDISATPSGEYVLQVEATDFGGSTATQQIPITIDRTAPTVTVLQPGAGAVLNGSSVSVRGEASDNRQLGAVFLWHGLVSDPDPAVLPSRTGPGTYSAGSYTQVTGASIWNLNIDTTATVSTAANGYRIRLVAVDSIGNVGTPIDHLVTIDQESDRPQISFSNLAIPGPSRLALGNLSIIGTASDDDSVRAANSFQIRIDRNANAIFGDIAGEDWVPISDPPSSNATIVSWVHVINDLFSEGLHHVQVRALDVNGTPGNYSTGYGWNESAVVPFFIDNGPPALTVATPTLGQRFNVNQFTVTGTTQDTNGIKRVVIWVDNDEDSIQDPGEVTILGQAMDNSGTALTTDNTLYNINQLITGLSDGVKTVRVTSYDSSDAITVRELTVVIDTTAPSAAISTPAASSTVNGTIAVIGTATDNYQVSQVYYNVRLTAAGAPSYPADYTLLTGQTYAWNFNLNTTGFADGAYTLRVVVADSAGNTNAASPNSVAFTIDQTTDRPVIDVLTLDELSPAVQNLLPPSLAVSGTVQDDDSVDRTKIEVRSRTLPAGVWSAWTAISNPPASNTALAIWSHTFTGFTDGQYEFQIRAADINDPGAWVGGAFSWSEIPAVPFAVDLSLPTGSITTPAAGSYHRSDVNITGTSADASGIKRITIAYDTGSGYGAENVLLNDTDPGDGYALAPGWSTSYPVSNGEGQVFFRVTITDAFDKIRTYESNFTVDTVAPTVSFQLPSGGATLNGSVLARGTTSDAGPVSQVWFKVNNAAGPGTWAAPADLGTNGWTLLSGTFNWEQRFKSTDLSNGAAMIYIVAVDAAGNRSNPTQPANQLGFTVNQSQNLPVVTLTTANNALLDNGGVITGTVTDDDGVNAATLEISFDGGSTWRAVSNPGTSGGFVSFSHALSAGAGLAQQESPYTVVVRASDIGENFDGGDFSGPQDIAPVQGTSASITIRKDDSDPVAGITSLNNGVATVFTLSGAYVSTQFTLVGTATDGVRVSTVEARLPGLAGHSTFETVTNTGTDFSTWSYAKTGLTLVGSTQNLEVRVTDVNGRSTTQAYTLLVDTTAPTVGFDSTALNPDTASGAYNGTVTFRGNATDNVLVSAVYTRFAASDPGAPDASFTGWTQAASAYSWTAVLDTTTVHNLGSDFAYRLYAVSVDAAGNVAARQNLAFTINQASDRPVLNLTSPTNGQVLQTNAKALGSLSEDDGLASVEIRIDRNNSGVFGDAANETYVSAGAVSGRNGNLDFDLSGLADGFYKLQVRVRDNQYATTLSAFNETESAVLDFSIDTLAPALSLDELVIQNRYGGADTTVTSNFNGTYVNNDFTLEFTATDASGIASVQTSLNNIDWTAASSLGGGVYQAAIPISALNDGTRVLYYRATDNNAKVTSALVTLIVDKTEPTVNFSSPSGISTLFATNAPNVNGTAVTVTGSISDGSSIASLTIVGGLTDNISFTNTGNNTSWAFTFDSTLYDEATFATDVGGNVWRLPIKVTAFDVAGNRVITTGYIDLDPDGDKPIVSISTPAANASVTGIVTLNGTVVDDDGTSGTVDISLDTNNDMIFGDQVFNNVPVSNGAWSQQINTGGTLSGTIRFRVTPRDVNGRLGDALDRTIFIDSSLPQIVGYDGASELPAPTPATGTRQRGTITVRALFKDDDVIPEGNLQVSLDGGSTYVAISTQPGYSRNQLADAGGFKRYDVQFQVNTATYFSNNSGTGSLSVILQITDNTFKPGVVSLSYATDNRPPEGYWDPEATLTPPVNGLYTFFGSGLTNNNKVIGSAVDGGAVSGISSVDVFFVKSGQILDPKTGTGIGVTNAVAGDLLYTQLSFLAGAINTGTDTITLDRSGWGTVNNALPVRFIGASLPGGLNTNTLYYVRDVAGNDFRLYTTPTGGSPVDLTSTGSGLMEYALTGVPFTTSVYPAGGAGPAYAIRIDRRTELGANDGNENGDGDGFQESLKDKGGFDEWFAYFNSTLLPDGPLTVYYVVNDENGNRVIGRINGQIANNPPSITSFVVGGNPLTGSPIKTKYAGTVDLTINANDVGGNAGIVASSWTLTVTNRYAADGGGDLNLAAPLALTPWYYGQNVGGNWKANFTGAGAGAPAVGTVSIDTTTDFVEGDWYRLEARVVDNDGNTATSFFYMRVNNNDTTAPIVTINALTQAAVSQWTSKTTPLALDIPSGSINAGTDTINVLLPSWIPNNTRVMFAGTSAPPGLNNSTVYFIVNKSGSTFRLSLTSGGAAVDITGTGSGTYRLVSGGRVEEVGNNQVSGRAAASGAILLTGTVSDDSDVQTLTINLDGAGAITVTPFNKTGDAVLGYSYDWQYLWDTSTLNSVAQLNTPIVLTASDFSGSSADGTATLNVDILPHVTTILDPTGLSADVLRGSTGRYSISQHASNTLTVRGYNLGRTGFAPAVRNSATQAGWAAGTLGAAPSINSINEILVTKNWTRSGYLTVVVNSVPSGNNLNNNSNANNIETTADPRTAQWNDDRYLWVWDTRQVNLTTLTGTAANVNNLTFNNPDMVMNGDQPEFAFNDENNGLTIYTTSDTDATRRTGFRLMRQAAYAHATVNATLQRFIATSFDSTWQTTGDNTGYLEVTGFANMTQDGAGRANGPSVVTDAIRWPAVQGIDYYLPNDETIGVYRNVNRFPHTKLLAETSNPNTGANLFLTYFDSSSYHRSLNFVSFRMTNNGTGNNNLLMRATRGYERSPHVVTLPGTLGNSSEYFDVVREGATGIAVAYYDETAGSLKLAANANAFLATGAAATEGLTNTGREVTQVNITNATKTNYSATASGSTVIKALKIFSGATEYNLIFDNTTAQNGVAPAGYTGGTLIRVNVNTAAASTTGITDAMITALRTQAPTVFEVQRLPGSTTQTYIIPFAPGNVTNSSTNLNTGTNVGNIATVFEGTDNSAWTTITVDDTADVGRYVSLANDGAGNLYLAYYDFTNANLKFARVSWNAGSPVVQSIVNIDNYLSAGTWTNVDLLTNTNLTGQATVQPVISYYSDSYNGTTRPVRFAFPRFDASTGTLSQGTQGDEGENDEYTGNWEVVTIPAITVPQGGAQTFNRTQLGTYSSGTLPVVGWLGSRLEYGKLHPNN